MLVWVITLTLCVSGYASAAMSRCGGMSPCVVQTFHEVADDIGMARDADMGMLAGAQSPGSDCTTTPGAHSPSKSLTGDCAASAACGMAAAPALQTPVIAAPAAGADYALPAPVAGFGFFTDAPDRPPRPLA